MKLSFGLILSFFAPEISAYSSGAPPYGWVLGMLRPGGPHSGTYGAKDDYSYDHHHIRLNIEKTSHHMAKVKFSFFTKKKLKLNRNRLENVKFG